MRQTKSLQLPGTLLIFIPLTFSIARRTEVEAIMKGIQRKMSIVQSRFFGERVVCTTVALSLRLAPRGRSPSA